MFIQDEIDEFVRYMTKKIEGITKERIREEEDGYGILMKIATRYMIEDNKNLKDINSFDI